MEVPLCTLATERIIVRASNPITFELKQDVSWCKNPNSETIYYHGKVGIGTEHSNEALTVQGNIQVAGDILSPSDMRIKKNISPVDTKKQLENLQKIQVVEFQYKPEYLQSFPDKERSVMDRKQMGVIAQDVRRIIPDAVQSSGDVTLASGRQVNNMLIVNKDRLFLENIGAVRELSKVTDNLGHRIDELETHTVRMSSLANRGSVKSTSSAASTASRHRGRGGKGGGEGSIFRNRWIQSAILGLVAVMTVCLLAMAVLYILDYQRRSEEGEGPGPDPALPNTTFTFPPSPRVVTTRSTLLPGLGTTGRGRVPTLVTTQRLATQPPDLVTRRPRRRRPPPPIGRPHDCSAPDVLRECETFCCAAEFSGPDREHASFNDNIDNNISAPGVDNTNYSSDPGVEDSNHVADTVVSVTQAGESSVVLGEELSNVLDVTGTRGHSSSSTTEQLGHAHTFDNTDTEEAEIAVRRAVEDETNGVANADNTDLLIGQRSQTKNVNFVADQRIEVGEEILRNSNKMVGRLPRNQRNFEEGAKTVHESVSGADVEEVEIIDVPTNENEIFNDDENITSVSSKESVEEDRSGSGTGQGKKSVKLLGTNNELKSSRLKRPFQNLPNIIEDSIKPLPHSHKSVAADLTLAKNLRRKRNVAQHGLGPDSVCTAPEAAVTVVTRSGAVNLTSDYLAAAADLEWPRGGGGGAGNCSYVVPLSRHMPDLSLELVFPRPVATCPGPRTPATLCPALNDVGPRFEPSAPVTSSEAAARRVVVAAHKVAHYRFRMWRDPAQSPAADPCSDTRTETFIEFNFKFYRDCLG